MDGLQLASSWQRGGLKRQVKQRAQVVEITGLLIQGAAFDGKALAEADANASELTALDCNVFLAFVPEGEGGAAEGELGVPLYFSTQRESVLDEISLPSDDQAKWVMAGVALFLTE